MDFTAHNQEAKAVWKSFRDGNPVRVPVTLGINPRYVLLDPSLNKKGTTFRQYFEDPDIMFETQLEFFYYIRHNIYCDYEMGIPEDGWNVYIDFQNVYDQSWFGCKINYRDGQVPDTLPFLADENKWSIFDTRPDPFGGIMQKNIEYYEHFREKAKNYEYMGKPVTKVEYCALGTDGPFTCAINLRGEDILLDMKLDPEYFHKLMDYLTENLLARIKAWVNKLGQDNYPWNGIADDSISLISLADYKEHVLPYHKRFYEYFATFKRDLMIHLCGNATRHFKTLNKVCNVVLFDTGFPVDFGRLREKLGEDVTIQGGPHVGLLLKGSTQEVKTRCREILQSGIMKGGKFVLRDGNNVAPGTPPENIRAMFESAKKWGVYTKPA